MIKKSITTWYKSVTSQVYTNCDKKIVCSYRLSTTCLHDWFRFKSKENKRVVTEQYLAMRKLYRETGLNAHTRKKMQDNGLWEPFLEELEKIKSDETRASSQWVFGTCNSTWKLLLSRCSRVFCWPLTLGFDGSSCLQFIVDCDMVKIILFMYMYETSTCTGTKSTPS